MLYNMLYYNTIYYTRIGARAAGFQTGPGRTPLFVRNQQDSATFKDAKNYYCDTWIGDACTDAYGAPWGYSAADMAMVLRDFKDTVYPFFESETLFLEGADL